MQSAQKFSKLSIIIPAYNEKATIEEIIRRISAVDLGELQKEIIVVDDGSTDGTRDILKTIPTIRYIFHEKNLGKGGAVKTGFREATGDILIIQDADLEYDPNDYPAMIASIVGGTTEATMGSRFLTDKHMFWAGGSITLRYFINHIGIRSITILTNYLYWNNATDYEGCYKAFTKRLIDSIPITANGFEYDNELVCKILKRGYHIPEVPIRYYPRRYEEGKKIRLSDGFKILWTIIRYRFVD